MLVLATVLCALLALPLHAAEGGGARAPAWRVHITPAGELFPALELSQRPGSGGGSGLVRVDIEAATSHGALVLTLATAGLRHPARLAIPAGAAGTQTLRPRLEWDPAALEGLGEARRQPLVATLEGAGLPVQVRRLEVVVHPLDEALYYVREGRDAVDLGWAFAGYVDPHDPAVDALLARTRELAPGLERLPARDRAEAIWRALEWRELRHAHGDPSIARGPVLWSQRVQPPGVTWHERRGSCIDASVLVASAFERMRLAPFILLVPGHALVGLDDTGAEPLLLETTALGRLATPQENFAAARASGARQWRAALPHLRNGGGPDYARIDIATARRYGIMPLRSGAATAAGNAAARLQSRRATPLRPAFAVTPASNEDRPDPRAAAPQATRAGSGRRHYGVAALCDPQSRAFAETAFRTLLERQPTPAETAAVLGRLASGTRKVEILGDLRWSAEGRRIGTRIGGLLPRYLMAKAARVPLIGYAAELVMALAALPLLAREQRALDSTLAATHEAETAAWQERQAWLDQRLSAVDGAVAGAQAAIRRSEDALATTARDLAATTATLQAVDAAQSQRSASIEEILRAHGARIEETDFLRQRLYAINHWSHQLEQALRDIESATSERLLAVAAIASPAARAASQADATRTERNVSWANAFAARLPRPARVLVVASGADWSAMLEAQGLAPVHIDAGADPGSAAPEGTGKPTSLADLLQRIPEADFDALSVLGVQGLARQASFLQIAEQFARVLRPGGVVLLACAREPGVLMDELVSGAAPLPNPDLIAAAFAQLGFERFERADAEDGTMALFGRRASSS